MLSNNDILKKLRIALSLHQDDIVKILALVEFNISKGALGDMFRNEDHPNYVVAGDQILRNFLNGLIIHKRGRKEDVATTIKSTPPPEKEKRKPSYFESKGGLKKRR
jgi:hypothetical protein